MEFCQMRNLTSHTYDEQKVQKVYGQILQFLMELERIITALERMNAASG